MEVKSSINIGTFCSHFQGGHWRKTPNMNNNNISAGQTTGRDFFKMVPSKKSKNTTSSTSAILSTGNGKSTNTKASNINSVGNKQDFLVEKDHPIMIIICYPILKITILSIAILRGTKPMQR